MYMLIILEIIDIFFFYSQRSTAMRLTARTSIAEAPTPLTPQEPIPSMDAMGLFFIYN